MSITSSSRSAALEAVAVAASLYPVALLGRLTTTVGANPVIDGPLQKFPVYKQVTSWMEMLAAKSIAGFVALVFFGFFIWLAHLAYARSSDPVGLKQATRIPRLFLKVGIPPVLSLFAFVAGGLWEGPGAAWLLFLLLVIAFVGYFLIEVGKGALSNDAAVSRRDAV